MRFEKLGTQNLIIEDESIQLHTIENMADICCTNKILEHITIE